MGITVKHPLLTDSILILNFYHHVGSHSPRIFPLLTLSDLLSTSVILGGNFNTHFPQWPPPITWRPSPWATPLSTWLDNEGFIPLNPPGSVTRESPAHRGSNIDFIFVNEKAFDSLLLPAYCTVSFNYTVSPDHAGLLLEVPLSITPRPPRQRRGWVVDPTRCEAWENAFNPTLPTPHDAASLSHAASSLLLAISDASDRTLQPLSPKTDGKGFPWWNTSCMTAAALTRDSHGRARRLASRALRTAIQVAKHEWYEKILTDPTTDLWSVATWRKGRHNNNIPPISLPSGPTADTSLMATAFSDRFFTNTPVPPSDTRTYSFPPFPTRSPHPVTEEEVRVAISSSSPKSAPGISGITYSLVRWAFETHPDPFTNIFTACLTLGHHPWGEAKVVVIPKPGRADYSLTKSYRPISLLECVSKVFEKVIARRLSNDVDVYSLIPPSQFGSRRYHSAPDAATLLRLKADTCIRAKRIGVALLFDISRFFDQLSPPVTSLTLQRLGVDPNTCHWIRSFMTDRSITMEFNDSSHPGVTPSQGTPQGSPLSPILSALYTSPLLHEALLWDDGDLTLYVDDGIIFTSGPTFISASQKAITYFQKVRRWLTDFGLSLDTDKTEVMFFHPKRLSPHHGLKPASLRIPPLFPPPPPPPPPPPHTPPPTSSPAPPKNSPRQLPPLVLRSWYFGAHPLCK